MLKTWQRLLVSLILVAPPLAMLVLGGAYLSREYRRVLVEADTIIAAEVAARLDREVFIGRAQVRRLGVAVMDDVRIAAERELSGGALVRARRATIHYDWRGLLFGGSGLGAIDRMVLEEPVLMLVRRTNGTFNISDLLRPAEGPPGPPFTGRIEIRDGTLEYRDFLAETAQLPAVIRLRGIDGVVSAKDEPRYRFSLAGTGDRGRFDSLTVSGILDLAKRSAALDVDGRGVSAAYLADYFGTPPGVDVLEGQLRVLTGLGIRWGTGKTQYTLTGTANLQRVAVRVPQVAQPVRQVAGSVAFAGDSAAVDLNGTLAGSRVLLTGAISNFAAPRLEMLLRVPSANFTTLMGVLRLPAQAQSLALSGTGNLTARITGLAADPVVAITAFVPLVRVEGIEGRSASITAVYRRDRLDITALRMRYLGAPLDLAGSVLLAGRPELKLRGRLGLVPLSSLPLPEYLAISGMVTGTFEISGSTSRPVISAVANISRGSVEGIAFASASASLRISGSEVLVRRLVVNGVLGGVITAAGRASPSALTLDVDAQSIDLAQLGSRLNTGHLSGTAFLDNGRLRGTPTQPQLSGRLQVYNGSYQDFRFDSLNGEFFASRDRIAVDSGVLRIHPGQMTFAGAASGLTTGRIQFRANVTTQGLPAQTVMALFGTEGDVSGTLVGSMSGSGVYLTNAPAGSRIVDATGIADFRLEDGALYGIAVDTAEAQLQLEGDMVIVQRVIATSGDAELASTHGTLDIETGRLEAVFSLNELALARLRAMSPVGHSESSIVRGLDAMERYVTVRGVASLQGTVRGTLASPVVSVSGEIRNPAINYKQFDEANVQLTYAGGVIESFGAALTRGDAIYAVSGSGYDPGAGCVDTATATIEAAGIADLWDMLRSSPLVTSPEGESIRAAMERSPDITGGQLSLSARLNGCPPEAEGAVEATISGVAIDGQEIDTARLVASISDGAVYLDEPLIVASGEMELRLEGSPIYRDGIVDTSVTAQNVDLTRLRPWLEGGTPGGVLSAEFDVDGEWEAPRVIGSIEVLDPSYGGVSFDRLRVSTVEIAGNRMDISGVILSAGDQQAEAEGYLPWNWAGSVANGDLGGGPLIPADEPLEFRARLREQDLSVLAALVPVINAEATSGLLRAEMTVSGTLADVSISGDATVTDGTLAVSQMTNTLTNLQMDLDFAGNAVIINQLSADSSMGGSVRVVPQLPDEVALPDIEGLERRSYFTIGALEDVRVNVLAVADGLIVEERNLLGYSEFANIRLDAGLAVVGSAASPLITDLPVESVPGGILLSDARITFTTTGAAPPRSETAFAINPRFDVGLRVGDNVQVSPPSMTLLVTGGGTLAGTLAEPDFDVALDVEEGTIRLAAVRLRLVPGGRIFVSYAPAEVQVNLEANTTVFATNVLGQRERYTLILNVTGPVDDLQIGLESSPPGLSREQMLAALGHVEGLFTPGEAGLEDELTSILSAVGASTIFAPIEDLFIEQLGFEEFALEYAPSGPLALYFSRHLFNSFYLSVYRVISGASLRPAQQTFEVALSYRLRRQYQFSVSIDNQETLIFGVDYTTAF